MTLLKETDIRPIDTMAEQKRRYERDVARLLEERASFVETDCPGCGSGARVKHFSKYSVDFQRCTSCKTVYLSPRPTPALLEKYYANSENYAYWNAVIFPASEDARRERIFRPRVERLLSLCAAHGANTGCLLEVGAGYGTFCEELASRGAFDRVIAVEPTPSLAETCRRKGIDVLESTIENATIRDRVDVICSFEVIEHLYDPGAFIRTCASRLSTNGLLVLTCPNINGFDIDVLGPLSPAVDIEHLNYFHPASLGDLLTRSGFTVVETQTPGRLDADIVRNRVLAGESTLEDGFLKRVLLDDWESLGAPFQDFLSQHGLSSNMWICARKN